jgi:cell division protein FtsB
MKTLIGGAAAAVLGIIGLAVWWKPFLQLLAGAVPFGLLSGGALAIYLGFDELKDTWKSKENEFATPPINTTGEVDKYKKEVDELKKEVKDLKGEKADKKTKK